MLGAPGSSGTRVEGIYIYMKLSKNKRFVEDYRAAAVTSSHEDLHVSLSGLTAERDKLKIKAFRRHITQLRNKKWCTCKIKSIASF